MGETPIPKPVNHMIHIIVTHQTASLVFTAKIYLEFTMTTVKIGLASQ